VYVAFRSALCCRVESAITRKSSGNVARGIQEKLLDWDSKCNFVGYDAESLDNRLPIFRNHCFFDKQESVAQRCGVIAIKTDSSTTRLWKCTDLILLTVESLNEREISLSSLTPRQSLGLRQPPIHCLIVALSSRCLDPFNQNAIVLIAFFLFPL
jgi:hypothetical protein